jgi:formamidopyrimidine-DNA glycosylase
MPEIPDLLYICNTLRARIIGRTLLHVEVRQPIVIRSLVEASFAAALVGTSVREIRLHGPFLDFVLTGNHELIVNLMLAGSVQHLRQGDRPEGYLCLRLLLDDGTALHFNDRQKMAKIYLTSGRDYQRIPRFSGQGFDVLSPDLTLGKFKEITSRHPRKQVRVFVNDQTILSAIGNAYADEILFEAHIHPKTLVGSLDDPALERLHAAIGSVLAWGIREVERAGAPIQQKIRGHLRVRNRKGEACPRCGTTIRREGVRGHDVFFCPHCQPTTRRLFIRWPAEPE